MGKKRGKKGGNDARPASAPPPTVNKSQELPRKEAALFQQIVKCYEDKQYKKGIKAADLILKNFPLHGETLAMKGLTYNCMLRKDEANVLVKKGLAMNIKSHVCWHVFGLLYRSDQKYNDAIKCYQNAIRIDPGNLQILKDLSLLQIQRRMSTGFTETRRKILQLKSNNRNNWIAYALGNHLMGNFTQATTILDNYTNSVKDKLIKNYEHGEMLLYKNMIIEESGEVAKAVDHLNEIKEDVLDELYLFERRGAMCLKLGRYEEAETDFRTLLDINPENHAYHYSLACSLKILDSADKPSTFTPEQSQKLSELYVEHSEKYPKVSAVIRLPLDFTTGQDFETRVSAYLQTRIRKGIPSLFRDLRSLYADDVKAKFIAGLVDSYIANLTKDRRFTESQEADSEAPSALVWALYFKAQSHDFHRESALALTVVDQLIQHTPTNVDSYVLKARILKHTGDFELAHQYMDQARRMDTADRYLNTKCTRYALRASQITTAEETVSMFLRDGDDLTSLYDMQCSWYENECGATYMRQQEYGKALKSFINVTKHFHEMEEDQFDFHSYCLRKMTLRSYVKMMRMEDMLRSHRFFLRASRGVVQAYLEVYESRRKLALPKEEIVNVADETLDPSEKKRLEKKAKREAAKQAKKDAAENAVAEEKAAKLEIEKKKAAEATKSKTGKDVDMDPDGEKLLKVEDPMAEASKFVQQLLLYSYDAVSTHVLACSVYHRRRKYLLWLRSLQRCMALAPSDASVLEQHVLFLHNVETDDTIPPVVKTVIQMEMPNSKSAKAVLADWAAQHATSVPHALAAARCKLACGETAQVAVKAFSSLQPGSATWQECLTAVEFLEGQSTETAASFKEVCAQRFPVCPSFMHPDWKLAEFKEKHAFEVPLDTYIATTWD